LFWERSRFQAWLGALVFVLACYFPWIPYFWEQLGSTRDFPGWGQDNVVDQILALLTFFAFGGSLFAAPGFLNAATRLSRVEILALLLPSVVVVSAGIASFRRDRRALAFMGLPPLVVIGAPLLLSIAKPLFAPRWFSFLVPFYMALVASGVSTIARSLRTRTLSIGTAVLIIAGLALYDVQVLRHYYFDPGLRDRWRDAAALVDKHRQPTDLLLYANFQAKIIFTYYLGDIHPSMLVVVGRDGRVEGAVPVGDQFPTTLEELVPFKNLAPAYRRVWFIVAPGGAFRSAQQQDEVFAHLLPTYVLEGFSRFPQSRWRAAPVYPYVYLFRAK